MNRRLVGFLAAPLLLLASCSLSSPSSRTAASVSCTGGTVAGLSSEQSANARSIAAVALSLGLGRQGALIGILTANIETDLRNLAGGDRDSVGLFQQRDPWGTAAERRDPTTAATMFFTGGRGGQGGLTSISGWESMDPGTAMQAVQRSAFAGGTSPGYAAKFAVASAATEAIIGGCAAAPVATGPAAGMEQNPSQDPSSFGWVRGAGQVPFAWQGRSLGSVASGTQGLWTALLNELVPLIPGGLNSNLGCYANRQNVNNPGRASFHAYGLACDLNHDVNANGVNPQGLQGRMYAIPMSASQIAQKYGMTWGGDWEGTPDPMHIELHLSPQQVAQWNAAHGIVT